MPLFIILKLIVDVFTIRRWKSQIAVLSSQFFAENKNGRLKRIYLSFNFLGQLKGKDETIEAPNYEPNTERTKKFIQRLEFGTNIQTHRSTSYYPVTSDLAFSVGYRFSKKSIAGFGAAYKLGLGESINNIRITEEGIDLRSFIDFKVKGNFFVTGGFEYNYQLPALNQYSVNLHNGWTTSGLLGATKSFNINNKFFKKSRIQVLWDFLARYQVPQRQQILFRVGYHF